MKLAHLFWTGCYRDVKRSRRRLEEDRIDNKEPQTLSIRTNRSPFFPSIRYFFKTCSYKKDIKRGTLLFCFSLPLFPLCWICVVLADTSLRYLCRMHIRGVLHASRITRIETRNARFGTNSAGLCQRFHPASRLDNHWVTKQHHTRIYSVVIQTINYK